MALSLDSTGTGTYDSHKLDDAPSPRPVQISAATTARIFALADSLNDFRSLDLDTHHKVANMGLKTLTYESGKETNRVQYNFTENHVGAELTGIFEKISNVEEEIKQLEYAMRYDRLALPDDLQEIQEGLVANNYLEPALMIPTLQKIISNSHYLHLAQSQAQEILQRIQASN